MKSDPLLRLIACDALLSKKYGTHQVDCNAAKQFLLGRRFVGGFIYFSLKMYTVHNWRENVGYLFCRTHNSIFFIL